MLERFRVSDTQNGGQIEDRVESNYRIRHTKRASACAARLTPLPAEEAPLTPTLNCLKVGINNALKRVPHPAGTLQ